MACERGSSVEGSNDVADSTHHKNIDDPLVADIGFYEFMGFGIFFFGPLNPFGIVLVASVHLVMDLVHFPIGLVRPKEWITDSHGVQFVIPGPTCQRAVKRIVSHDHKCRDNQTCDKSETKR